MGRTAEQRRRFRREGMADSGRQDRELYPIRHGAWVFATARRAAPAPVFAVATRWQAVLFTCTRCTRPWIRPPAVNPVMPPLSPARRLSLVVAAVTGGLMVAMIVEIMLARRGVEFTDALRGRVAGSSVRLHAALAWWAVTGVAFLASFVIAAVMSRLSWLYFRSLRGIAAAALALALAVIGNLAPLSAPGAATAHAIASLAAMLGALMMACFGAFFAVRR